MASEMDTEQALALLDSYHRQVESLARQMNFLQAVLDETRRARTSLEGLKAEANDDLLVPLGANTFLQATVADRTRVLTGIGAGLTLEKPFDDAHADLVKREQQISGELQTVGERVVRMQQEAAGLQEQLEAMGVLGAPMGQAPLR